jgi:hypothetical protein
MELLRPSTGPVSLTRSVLVSVEVSGVIEPSISDAIARSVFLGFEAIDIVAKPLAGLEDGFFFFVRRH